MTMGIQSYIDKVKVVSSEINFLGEKRSFRSFGEKFQLRNVKKIFSGDKFPVPPIDPHMVDCVFDVGANIGAASIFFAASFPNARIHAFEPNLLSSPLLRQNIDGIERIEFHPYGLSNFNGDATIRIAGSGGGASSIKSTINPVASHPISIRDAGQCLGDLAAGKRSILLKIDTEGCEAEILERISDLLPRIQAVYVEYHSEEQRRRIDRVLTGHGLLLFGSRAVRPHRGDLYYVREGIVANIPQLDRFRCD